MTTAINQLLSEWLIERLQITTELPRQRESSVMFVKTMLAIDKA
jgi:hypothetical protein